MVDAERLDHHHLVADEDQVREDRQVDHVAGHQVEIVARALAAVAEARLQIVAGRQRPHGRPRAGGNAGTLVDDAMAVAERAAHHRRRVGIARQHGLGLGFLAEQIVGAMGEGGMDAVGGIVPGHLPVAAIFLADGGGQDAQRALRMAVDMLVEPGQRRAEPFGKRHGLGGERAEDEAAIALDLQLAEIEGTLVELVVAVGDGEVLQLPVHVEGPAMIGAGHALWRSRALRRPASCRDGCSG